MENSMQSKLSPVVEKKPTDVKPKKSITILEPFVEKWEVEFKRFQSNYKAEDLDEENKKDYAAYQKQMDILSKKAEYFFDGINNFSRAPANARKIDAMSELEKQFKIVGPITRDFSDIYRKYLEDFINLKFSKIEKATIFTFAKTYKFQTLSQRKKEARMQSQRLELEIQKYDNALKYTSSMMKKITCIK